MIPSLEAPGMIAESTPGESDCAHVPGTGRLSVSGISLVRARVLPIP
jgi:hypothetical protein